MVQQKQGRVKPTLQLKEKVNINDDAGLEKEADVMGEKAVKGTQSNSDSVITPSGLSGRSLGENPVADASALKSQVLYPKKDLLVNHEVEKMTDQNTFEEAYDRFMRENKTQAVGIDPEDYEDNYSVLTETDEDTKKDYADFNAEVRAANV